MIKKVYIFNYYNEGELVDTKVSDSYDSLLSYFKNKIDDFYDDIDSFLTDLNDECISANYMWLYKYNED